MGKIGKITLTHKRLVYCLDYDPDTGIFTRDGKIAGYRDKDSGYITIGIDNTQYSAHRLAWFFYYGYWPENQIDHKDQIKHHNWISNLREATDQCQRRNSGNRIDNKTGVKGVTSIKEGRWRASITINSIGKNLGHFDDFDEAVCHRLAAEQCLNWSGCDSNSPAYQYVKKLQEDK